MWQVEVFPIIAKAGGFGMGQTLGTAKTEWSFFNYSIFVSYSAYFKITVSYLSGR
jgi:hypothetical protein